MNSTNSRKLYKLYYIKYKCLIKKNKTNAVIHFKLLQKKKIDLVENCIIHPVFP